MTEETEAIVLKRARDKLESAKMSLEASRITSEFAIQYGIPRADEQTKESSERRELATERARIAVPETLQRQQINVEKLRVRPPGPPNG